MQCVSGLSSRLAEGLCVCLGALFSEGLSLYHMSCISGPHARLQGIEEVAVGLGSISSLWTGDLLQCSLVFCHQLLPRDAGTRVSGEILIAC